MSKVQMLRSLVNERLTAAAEEIFALFERTIAEYEEELCGSKEEKERRQQLLDSVLSPRVLLETTDAQSPQIKEEPEEPSIDQLQELTDVCVKSEQQLQEFPSVSVKNIEHLQEFPSVSVGSEDQEECEGAEMFFIFENDFDKAAASSTPQTETDQYNHRPEFRNKDSESEIRAKPFKKPRSKYLFRNEYNQESCVDEKPFSCSVCTESFRTEDSLDWHMQIHGPFSCSFCLRSFTTKRALNRHMESHSIVRPFSCSVCPKSYTEKSHLARHMLSHTGERPFQCSFCSATFAFKHILVTHLRIHTGEKPFSCSVCGVGFAHKVSLRTHTAMHRGEKPFSCSECHKGFNRKHSLSLHMSKQHPNKRKETKPQ